MSLLAPFSPRPPAAPPRRALVVATTTRQWVADDLADACERAGVDLIRSFALDVPDLSGYEQVAWWTPTEHAARLLANGVEFSMAAPGPHWLPTVDRRWLGRSVWTGSVADLPSCPQRIGWMKPAEFKHEALPARYYRSLAEFGSAVADAGLPQDAVVQVSAPCGTTLWEFRFFIAHGKVVAHSPYLDPDGTVWHEGMSAPDSTLRLAQDLAEEAAARTPGPGGYVLDVAQTRRGPVLLEANPVFSSATYGARPDGVLKSLLAAQDADPQWRYRPDPYLIARAARQRPLPVAGRP